MVFRFRLSNINKLILIYFLLFYNIFINIKFIKNRQNGKTSLKIIHLTFSDFGHFKMSKNAKNETNYF